MPHLTEKKVFSIPECMTEKNYHFCPGCHHGLIHRLIGEVIDEYNFASRTVGVIGVGCGVMLYDYIAVDCCEAPHGRAPAVATGIKRANPGCVVFTYQGDGDLAAIGTNEIIHTANRQENITVVFVNNIIYGMTGGQMAPTTLPGQKTTTTPAGRKPAGDGYPMNMAELIASLPGTAFSARVSCHDNKHIREARKAMKRAFQTQIEGRGFAMIELLSACPTNWRLSPQQSIKKICEDMIPAFPLGTFKDYEG